jgi:hypothetical protein
MCPEQSQTNPKKEVIMLDNQVKYAKEILQRIHKYRQLRIKGLSFSIIERDFPDAITTSTEIENFHESVKPILADLFGDDSEQMKEWRSIPKKYEYMVKDPEVYYIQILEHYIIFLNKIETQYTITKEKQLKTQEPTTGQQYYIGTAFAVGPYAKAQDITFIQIWNQVEKTIDLTRLVEELGLLRQEMKMKATEQEHDIAVGAVAIAEQAAKAGNGPKALESLKSAGKWALELSEKIGIGVATAAIKTALGL